MDSQYLPTYTPPVLHQWVWNYEEIQWAGEAGCCVATALANALKILEYRDKGTTTKKFSVSYIYGNRRLHDGGSSSTSGEYGKEEDGMVAGLALDQLKNNGTPEWELVPENVTEEMSYPDNRFLTDNFEASFCNGLLGASTIFENGQYNGIQQNAVLNRTITKGTADFYDSEVVASLIQNYGFFVHTFCIPENFYGLGNTGIVPEPDVYSGFNHTLLLIGWKTINSKIHWIGLNGWDTTWGDDGLCYIPIDWAENATPPDGYTSWAWEGYSTDFKTEIANTCPIKMWNGTAWETVPMKKHNGSSWTNIPLKIFG